ncbi:MAG: hypothetical protein PUC12_14540 [Clostridiales bacterium]|nr:hypothetical protein [Clostridiales bacterium]
MGVLSCSVIPVIILSVWIEQKVGVFICNYLSFLFGIGLGFLYDNTDGFSVILYPLFAVVVFVEFICITNSIIVHTHTELKKVKETENEVRGMIEDDERWKRLEDVWK